MHIMLQTIQDELKQSLKRVEGSILREYEFPRVENMIKVAIGIRRSGKTYFLLQNIQKLILRGVPEGRILYINFEDDRLLPMNTKEMGALIDSWYTLYPENHDHRCFLFFDAVQNVPDWALVLRRCLDSKNVEIYATGSSSKMLSKEIATSLRGRSLSIEIFPYSYLEHLSSLGKKFPEPPFGKRTLDYQKSYLQDYFQIGGFPAVQKMEAPERHETLQGYVGTVIFRDVIERYQVANIPLLKYFIKFLLKNIASPFSVHKCYNDLKSQGHKISKDTLYNYLDYLEDAFLFFSVPIFTESLRKLQTTPKKIYAVDNGLIQATTMNIEKNLGVFFENQVYLDLRREKKEIFYYSTESGYEIDFVTKDLQGKYELIQVAFELDNEKTKEREERALKEAEKELRIPGRIIDFSTYVIEKGQKRK